MAEDGENALYQQDLYALGRAHQAAGDVDRDLWVRSTAYREGLADERRAQIDQELRDQVDQHSQE